MGTRFNLRIFLTLALSPKNVPNHYSEQILFSQVDSDLAHFFADGKKF
jgi:hypothetical protein